jgi:hypothetical protein
MKKKLVITVLFVICCVGCDRDINRQTPAQLEFPQVEAKINITKDWDDSDDLNEGIICTTTLESFFRNLPLQEDIKWTFVELMNADDENAVDHSK